MTVSVLWLFLAVPWVGLRNVFVVFPDQGGQIHWAHTHFVGFVMLRLKFNHELLTV